MDGESKRSHNRLGVILQNQPSEPESLPLYYLREITNNFCDEHLLGKGGFGIVYKGVVQNGDMIAVKKLTLTTPEIQDRQFENEVRHLMGLKHPNIVQLVGYCSETQKIPLLYKGKYVCAEESERLICLEYLPKGSLREHLSDEKSGLDWDTRYRIIQGICYGLHYLHEEWNVNTPIIHMDLKPPNILLDDNMVPKIADFGLSRLFGEEQTRTCTASRDGTLGYMAPEYINRGLITKKLDIFSLGVIIIEIMTGHKDYPYETEASSQKFTELVLKNWRNRLENASRYAFLETDCQQIRRCIEIGLACVKVDWEERPTTYQIIKLLHGLEGAEYNRERLDFFEDVAPLLSLQLGGSTMDGITQIFNSYVNLLISVSADDEANIDGLGNKIVRMAETEEQQLSLLANAYLLAEELLPRAAMKLSSTNEPNMDDFRKKGTDKQNRVPEQREWKRKLQRMVDRLRDTFCRQHALELIFTDEGDTHLSAEMYINMDYTVEEPEWVPSPIFQELYAKLNRMASIAAEMFVGRERVATLLMMRLTETVILWVSEDQSFWDEIEQGPRPLGPLGLQQFYLDMQFVIMFGQGRFLSRQVHQVILDIIDRAVAAFSATGMNPDSVLPGDDWFLDVAQEVISMISGRGRAANGDREVNSPTASVSADSISSFRSHGSS